MKRSLRALRSAARQRAAVLTALVIIAAGTAFAIAGPLLHAAAPSSARTASVVSGVLRAEVDALQQAQLSRRPVTVSALTTEVSQTVANPNGTLTNSDYVEPVRVRKHGAWQPVSATLRRDASGSWQPQAVPSGVTLSGGGGGPLATLTSVTGEQLSLSFPVRLPAPVVSGATATYKSVWPGIDLQVTVDTLGGLTWTVIARNVAAAANPALRNLQLGMSGPRLAVSSDKTGNLRATGPGGSAQFSGPPATMWDSRTSGRAVASQHAGPSMTSTAAAPGSGARIALIRGRLTGRTLRLTPAAAMLSRTSSYPVYLSASIAPDATMLRDAVTTAARGRAATTNGLVSSDSVSCDDTVQNKNEACVSSGNAFVEVQKACTGATNYSQPQTEPGDGSAYTGNGIGYNWWNTCIGVYRSFYEFDTSSLIATLTAADHNTPSANLWVQTATLDAWVPYSADWGCTDHWPAYLDWSGPIKPSTNWTTQPGTDANDQQKSNTTTPGPNPNSSCTQQEIDFDVTYAIADIVNSGSGNITFRLEGDEANAANNEPTSINPNATDPNLGFTRLGDNPNILTVFDLNPPTPTNLQTSPAAAYEPGGPASYGCADSTSNLPWIGAADTSNSASQFDLQASISAGITAEPVEARYTMWDNGAAIPANQVTGNGGASANWFTTSPATTNTAINFSLQDGERYTWTTQAFVSGIPEGTDPGYWSAQAPTCGFNVDMTPPTTPTVTSTAFPPTGNAANESYAGTSGTFSFSSTDPKPASCGECLTSGVYEFAYSLNSEDALTSDETTAQIGCGNATATDGTVAANSSGQATSCPITPTLWGTNILYVAAVDKAGNISHVVAYYFYVPWDPDKHPVPGDVDGDSIPDLLATGTGIGNDLTLYSGNKLPRSGGSTDLEPSTSTASTEAESPDGSSWQDYQVTHRGPVSQVSASANVDDLYAHKNGGASLYLYKNAPSHPGISPQFGDTSGIVTIPRPACSVSCSGYGSDWSAVTQILSPGDAWNPTATADDTTDDGEPSLLTVENGELWLFQGSYAPGLQDPVELGSSGWGGITLAAPGYVGGRLTIWAYDNASGNLYSYPVYLVNGVPSLSSSSTTPIQAEQQGAFFTYRYPHPGVAIASAGPIDMYPQPGSNNDANLPGLFVATPPPSVYFPERLYYYNGSYTTDDTNIPDARDAVVEGSVTDPNQVTQTTCQNGCLWYYPLQQSGFTFSLSATPEFVGDLPAAVKSLS